MSEVFLTAAEVAALLKIKVDTIYSLAAKGQLPGAKIGGQWRFMESRVRQWFEASTQASQSSSVVKLRESKAR